MPAPPTYATGSAFAIGLGLAAAGFVAGPVAALVTGRGRKPAADAEAWRRIRSLLRWLAVAGISTHLLFNLILCTGFAFVLTLSGTSSIVNGG